MKPDVETDFELNVSPEFIADSIKNSYRQHKKSGPYTRDEKTKRQNEIYRLHFEYGYSARKIAELMKVNRNTINSDIQYWYSKVIQKNESTDLDALIMHRLERLEIQRTRVREMLDKTDDFQQKITIEKMLFDIETKILQINVKIVNSTLNTHDHFIDYINTWMEEHKLKKSDFILTENYHIRLRENTAKLLIEKIRFNFNNKMPYKNKNFTYQNILYDQVQQLANFISDRRKEIGFDIPHLRINRLIPHH